MNELVAKPERPLFSFARWGRRSQADPTLPLNEWANYFNFMGLNYQLNPSGNFTLNEKQEEPDPSYLGYSMQIFKNSSVVYACMDVRKQLFASPRFQFQKMQGGKPGDLFGTQELAILEEPWVNGTTADLMTRMIMDVDIAGNFYGARLDAKRLHRMRPDWVTIILGSKMEPDHPAYALDCEVIGYAYHPGGPAARREPIPLLPEHVAHWAPNPDPLAAFRGMSWLTPVVREVMADSAATTHKLKFFEHGATPNLAVKLDKDVQAEAYNKWIELFEAKFGEASGAAAMNAYKTLFLGGGADIQVIGANMRQVSFKETQGAGETRIAAAAGVPPVIVGLSEGLAAATYSNYQTAMRRFTDLTMHPLWGSASSALAPVVRVPGNARLWYDAAHVPALATDAKDNADIQVQKAVAIKMLVDAGYESDSVISAILGDDFSKLVHTGMFSVQLQPAGTVGEGKGSLFQGVVVGKDGKPVANGSAPVKQAAAILAEYLGRELATSE